MKVKGEERRQRTSIGVRAVQIPIAIATGTRPSDFGRQEETSNQPEADRFLISNVLTLTSYLLLPSSLII